MTGPIADRRQSAREAFWDSTLPTRGVAAAIETATRVKITEDVVKAYGAARRKPGCTCSPQACPHGGHVNARRLAGLRAAFEAAGFEVTE